MGDDLEATIGFLETVHPYDTLPKDELARVASFFVRKEFPTDTLVYQIGDVLSGIYLIKRGGVEVLDRNGGLVSLLSARNTFGERGLMRDGLAATTAHTREDSTILMLPAVEFRELIARFPAFERFFNRGRGQDNHTADISTLKVADLVARKPLSCEPSTTVAEAARMMRDSHISSLGVTEDGRLLGILTVRDLANKVLAEGRSPQTPVSRVMTAKPISLPPDALGSDILHIMLERKIGHLPIVEGGRFVGMVTQTDLTRFQAVSAAALVRDVAGAETVEEMASVTARIPRLLVQLVGGNHAHEVVTRLITDIADAVTRRLLAMAEAKLGTAPVPYLWLACGSQGRQEQTGVSDQDNCMIIHNNATPDDMAYFAKMAKIVSDGLNACGYVYCPGDMMATADRWRVRQKLWRDYFQRWIAVPSNEAQMLASVMFDLRPIGGTVSLYQELQDETLELASKNSIFVAHMIANSLKHTPPLGLIRGFATIRSGEYRNHIDMKHNGVVPVADLARVYALQGSLTAANTRARLQGAEAAGVISSSGARDLIEAYDLIASMRLENQAHLVRSGRKPDNFLSPSDLSDFERSHLRDAFVVVRTMQSALSHGKGAPG